MVLRIGMCDDERLSLNYLNKLIAKYQDTIEDELMVEIFDNGTALLEAMRTREFHIVFLDVEMTEMNSGIEIARAIRKENQKVLIVFITSHEDFALDAFRVSASQYLLKPVDYKVLADLLDRLIRQMDANMQYEKHKDRHVVIESIHGLEKVRMNDIIYIEKERNKLIYHMTGQDIISYDTIKNVVEQYKDGELVQINQGVLVNWTKVQEADGKKVVLEDICLPVSRSYAAEVRKKYKDEIMGREARAFLTRI